MKLLKYLYYRIYKLLNDKINLADSVAIIYINAILYVFAGLLFTVLQKVVLIDIFFQVMIIVNPVLLQLLTFLLISIFSYFYLYNKTFEYYEIMFGSKITLNSKIKTWMILILPVILIALGILIDIYIDKL